MTPAAPNADDGLLNVALQNLWVRAQITLIRAAFPVKAVVRGTRGSSTAGEVSALVERVAAEHGRLDILVNGIFGGEHTRNSTTSSEAQRTTGPGDRLRLSAAETQMEVPGGDLSSGAASAR
jgi:NAD(P)-dependent dehydrogenase (short-subunit alcohol dehydrogenase family)